MVIKKRSLFFHFFVFFFLLVICHRHHHHLVTAQSMVAASTEQIEQPINETPNICKDILGKVWKNDTDKPLHESIATLNVCVPKKAAFHEFIDFNENGTELKGGFSIAIFCLVLQELPFKIQPIFMLVEGNYTEVIQKLDHGQDCDAVAGDITITSSRTKYADFTIPYMSSEIYMLVPAERKGNQTLVTLIKPFTNRLWLVILVSWLATGAAIGYLEYQEENPDFYNVAFYKQLCMIIWLPASKIFFQQGEIRNKYSKFVFVVWLTTIFIVMQIFTASLSSWLTINQLQPKVSKKQEVAGYQNGSFVLDYINDHLQRFDIKAKPISLSSEDDYKYALDNRTVDAIYDELPYIDIFLAKYGDNYMKVGPIAAVPGIGFAFCRGSQLLLNFSDAIINVTESSNMANMKKTYGIQNGLLTQPSDISLPQSLDVKSFSLLFMFMGLSTTIAILISEISRMPRRTSNNSNDSREMRPTSENSTQNNEHAQ